MFIRYFASTSVDANGLLALAYCRSLLRIAPVRVVAFDGGLWGPWETFSSLLITPMVGAIINVVCGPPERWVWRQTVSAGKDTISKTCELYTEGLRNVLLAPAVPTTPAQIGTALRYECLVVPSVGAAERWRSLGADPRVIVTPVTDHRAMRDAIMPR